MNGVRVYSAIVSARKPGVKKTTPNNVLETNLQDVAANQAVAVKIPILDPKGLSDL